MLFNKIYLNGRIDSNPTLRRTSTGKTVVYFTLKCDGDKPAPHHDAFDVTAWNNTNELARATDWLVHIPEPKYELTRGSISA